MIDVKNLNKTYGEKEAAAQVLKHVSFSLEKGCFCSIVGPSGSGKSTLLNILGGLETADSGMITVDGAPVCGLSSRQELKYRREYLGFIFQFYNLIPNLTALENVELASQICKKPLNAKRVLQEVGLGERMGNFPAQLSGGEQQRVSIARALAKNPKLLLCDEPTGALDSFTSSEIMGIFKELNRSGKTVIVVTHDAKVAESCKRLVCIEDGRIKSDSLR